MYEKKYYNNPKDLLNETYNGDKFPLVDKKVNAWVMPLDMVQDVDALSYSRFYSEELDKVLHNSNKNATH